MRIHERVEELATSCGDKFIEIACEPLPEPFCAARREEWYAEFPAILADDKNPWLLRIVTLLAYAADQIRGTWSARSHREQFGLSAWLVGTCGVLCFRAVSSFTFMMVFFIGNGVVTLIGFVVSYVICLLLGIGLGASMLTGAWSGASLKEIAGVAALKVGCVLLVVLVGWLAGSLGGVFHGATHGAIVLGVSSGVVLGIGGGLTLGDDTEPVGAVFSLAMLLGSVTLGLVHGVRSGDELACDVGNLLTGFIVVVYAHGVVGEANAQFGHFGVTRFAVGVLVGSVMMLTCLFAQLSQPCTVRFLGIGAGRPRNLARFQ